MNWNEQLARRLDGRIGEGWGGDPGPNGCHVNVVLGVRGTPTAAALLGTFTTPAPGHTPILVVVGEAQDRYEVGVATDDHDQQGNRG